MLLSDQLAAVIFHWSLGIRLCALMISCTAVPSCSPTHAVQCVTRWCHMAVMVQLVYNYTFDDGRRGECAHQMNCARDAEERDKGSNTEASSHVLLDGHVFCQHHRCNGYVVESGEYAYQIWMDTNSCFTFHRLDTDRHLKQNA